MIRTSTLTTLFIDGQAFFVKTPAPPSSPGPSAPPVVDGSGVGAVSS